ncbi:2-C-methyl-D-erythritol 4-phosphate cytidylyltransferase [Salinivibrio sp. IB643]|uniref:2-C-methyl-D-erythritol 4-phosphate cytidylyltransferase n=1 Tax=Salinivibrio sp. IB643 TaxID=1909445 RepID=UPI0009D397D1|nr:2-C-methyl-D-erythritol 4-phosphate cytidylyltransferase [Salinivibrio sp. IB643]OOE98313.1 2-C-methyl-D-erythritol 4-phosphate cytidylyltransferase [Salinivibrio sp. IB643]
MVEQTSLQPGALRSGISAVVPAAGVGRRMQAHCPKQYLTLAGKTLLQHTVERLLAHPAISSVVIAISANDGYFAQTGLGEHADVQVVTGGLTRATSVQAGLAAVTTQWVMVHDAARPCVTHADIDALIAHAQSHQDGALLAAPVRDTMKRANNDGQVAHTVEREALWHALTPQMFLTQTLKRALEIAGDQVTDEASAIEAIGGHPILVPASASNIKVTHPEDQWLAAFYLSQQEGQA